MIHIGLPKKGVIDHSISFMQRYFDIDYDKDKLTYSNRDMTFHLLKQRDIPIFVAEGKLDWGITSTDWIAEKGLYLDVIDHLDWCNSRISLIGVSTTSKDKPRYTCVTEFPNIARNSFLKQGIENIEIHPISGSCESMVPSLYDYCVDCVETGGTIQKNNLVEINILFESHMVLVCPPSKAANIRTMLR